MRPTLQMFQRYLKYEASTGKFYWIAARTNRVKPGQRAGALSAGYIQIGIFGKVFKAHQLAWLFVYGEWPDKAIDHINRNKADNRIENLRLTTTRENSWNREPREIPMGVSASRDKWRARIRIGTDRIHLGTFNSPEEAWMAYFAAAKEAGI